MARTNYPPGYYEGRDASVQSAAVILPMIFDVYRPKSVVDLGCGNGAWLSKAMQEGISDVLGLDGRWVNEEQLLIPKPNFRRVDLEAELPSLGRRFELAICVEVLEHVSAMRAKAAVGWLCQHAPVVVFSAAIPGQGGKHHINEAWLTEWAAEFAAQGFVAVDLVRRSIWSDGRVATWYRQNLVVMIEGDLAKRLNVQPADARFLDLVHPLQFARKAELHRRLYARSVEGRLRAIKRFILRHPKPSG